MIRTAGRGRMPAQHYPGDRPSSFAAMMKSFSCKPLIFLVCSETVA